MPPLKLACSSVRKLQTQKRAVILFCFAADIFNTTFKI